MNESTQISINSSKRQSEFTLMIDRRASLHGQVSVESPFRIYRVLLENFTGGAFSYVATGCEMHNVSIGRYCSIGRDFEILSSHPSNWLTTSPFPYQVLFDSPFDDPPVFDYENMARTTIGNDVWIGSGVKVKAGCVINDGAIIGAGSVVTKDVPAFAVVGGAPARLIRMRFTEQVAEKIKYLRWWDYDIPSLRLPAQDVKASLSILEQLIDGPSPPKPYVPGYCKIFKEGEEIKASRI